MPKFTIYQKLIQCDYYQVEAKTAAEALKIYKERAGDFESQGSTGGWPFEDKYDVIVESENTYSDRAGLKGKK